MTVFETAFDEITSYGKEFDTTAKKIDLVVEYAYAENKIDTSKLMTAMESGSISYEDGYDEILEASNAVADKMQKSVKAALANSKNYFKKTATSIKKLATSPDYAKLISDAKAVCSANASAGKVQVEYKDYTAESTAISKAQSEVGKIIAKGKAKKTLTEKDGDAIKAINDAINKMRGKTAGMKDTMDLSKAITALESIVKVIDNASEEQAKSAKDAGIDVSDWDPAAGKRMADAVSMSKRLDREMIAVNTRTAMELRRGIKSALKAARHIKEDVDDPMEDVELFTSFEYNDFLDDLAGDVVEELVDPDYVFGIVGLGFGIDVAVHAAKAAVKKIRAKGKEDFDKETDDQKKRLAKAKEKVSNMPGMKSTNGRMRDIEKAIQQQSAQIEQQMKEAKEAEAEFNRKCDEADKVISAFNEKWKTHSIKKTSDVDEYYKDCAGIAKQLKDIGTPEAQACAAAYQDEILKSKREIKKKLQEYQRNAAKLDKYTESDEYDFDIDDIIGEAVDDLTDDDKADKAKEEKKKKEARKKVVKAGLKVLGAAAAAAAAGAVTYKVGKKQTDKAFDKACSDYTAKWNDVSSDDIINSETKYKEYVRDTKNMARKLRTASMFQSGDERDFYKAGAYSYDKLADMMKDAKSRNTNESAEDSYLDVCDEFLEAVGDDLSDEEPMSGRSLNALKNAKEPSEVGEETEAEMDDEDSIDEEEEAKHVKEYSNMSTEDLLDSIAAEIITESKKSKKGKACDKCDDPECDGSCDDDDDNCDKCDDPECDGTCDEDEKDSKKSKKSKKACDKCDDPECDGSCDDKDKAEEECTESSDDLFDDLEIDSAVDDLIGEAIKESGGDYDDNSMDYFIRNLDEFL